MPPNDDAFAAAGFAQERRDLRVCDADRIIYLLRSRSLSAALKMGEFRVHFFTARTNFSGPEKEPTPPRRHCALQVPYL